MLHRYSIFVASLTFILIGVGAWLTSTVRPLPGLNAGQVVEAPGMRQAHLFLAVLVVLLVLGLALWMRSMPGWIALALAILDGGLGTFGAIPHAIVAPILFAAVVAAAVVTSESWNGPQTPTPALSPPLRKIAVLAPILVLLQITLGAAFRHNAMGVVWHILNAGIVLLLLMILGVTLLRQYPEHPTLRPAAIAMLIVAGIQVLLGFAVYLILLIVSENNMALIVTGVLHVLNGSLTLAATLALTLTLRHCAENV